MAVCVHVLEYQTWQPSVCTSADGTITCFQILFAIGFEKWWEWANFHFSL